MTSITEEKATLFENIMDHLRIAGPVIFSFVMRKSVDIVSVVFIGHLGAHYLSSAGLASVTANVTGNSMVIGLTGALSTLCSQANGAKDLRELCVCLQRAILIISIFICLPMTILWIFSKPVMIYLGQDAHIAHDASRYLMALVPGLWAMAFAACIQNWLYSMGKTKALVWITLSLALVHPVICYLYIYQLDLGYLGAAMAVSTTKFLEFVSLLLYLRFFSTVLQDTEFQWSWECTRNWWPYLRIALPNLLMMSEWWASEIIIFLSGTLSDPQLEVAAMSVYQNLLAICFMFPSGFRVSGETIVGNALGAGNSHVAASASFIAPALTFATTTVIAIVMVTNSSLWGRMFTGDQAVVALVSSLMPVLSLYIVLDGLQASLTGVIKGMGRQRIAGPIVFCVYYLIGIPVSAYLALGKPQWGIYGLCVGTLVGTAAHFICFACIVYLKTDWDHEVAVVAQRSLQAQKTQQKLTRMKDVLGGAALDGYDSVSGDNTDSDSWWDELSFTLDSSRDDLSDKSRHGRNSNHARGGGNNTSKEGGAWTQWLGAVRTLFGGKAVKSEYELVRTYTESLSALHLDEEDEEVEIDFDFVM